MIKLEIVQGEVEFTDMIKNRTELARNGMNIDDTGDHHYRFRSKEKSQANIIINGSCINLKPNSELNLTNMKDRVKTHPACQGAKLIIGKIWAKVTQLTGSQDKEWEKENQAPNAVVGIRG